MLHRLYTFLKKAKIELKYRLYFFVYAFLPEKTIFYPFDPNGIGGPSTFMRLFHTQFQGYDSSTSIWCKPKIVFFPIQYDLRLLDFWKNRGVRIFQRLDGIYYPSHFSDKFLRLNIPVEKVFKEYADHIIFQSHYSKSQCESIFGEATTEYSIVVNGVNQRVFGPGVKKSFSTNRTIQLVMTGNFREVDMVEPLVKMMDLLQLSLATFHLNLIGPMRKDYEDMFDRSDVSLLGSMESNVIATKLHDFDIFVYSFLNPNCPNSVIEAISCGLPVVGFDSGSMAELCHFQQSLLAPVSNEVIQDYADFDGAKLAKKVLFCIENFKECKQVALDNAHLYDIEETIRQYKKIMGLECQK